MTFDGNQGIKKAPECSTTLFGVPADLRHVVFCRALVLNGFPILSNYLQLFSVLFIASQQLIFHNFEKRRYFPFLFFFLFFSFVLYIKRRLLCGTVASLSKEFSITRFSLFVWIQVQYTFLILYISSVYLVQFWSYS